MATAWLSYLIARKLSYSQAALAIVFVVFMPLYCIMMLTGLTEILFSFVLILALYLFFRESYILSAIVISFLPFARSEGIIILPFFFFAFLYRKKFFPLPFLLTGFLFLSILGTFYYKDFFWIITHNPYPIHHPIYKEKGPLLHFVSNLNNMIGFPLLILVITGIIDIISRLFRGDKESRRKALSEVWLILFPFGAYFLFHSFLYWKALGGSLGLIRVIAGVLPLASLLAVAGYEYIGVHVLVSRFQKIVLLLGTLFLLTWENFSLNRYPVPLGPEETLIRKAANWVKDRKYDRYPTYYNDLNVLFYLDKDPFDPSQSILKCYANYLADMPRHSIFIWDAHFGPNECRVPLDSVMRSSSVKLLNLIRPEIPATTLNNYNYEIYIFGKVPADTSFDNYAIRDSIIRVEENDYHIGFSLSCDFERVCLDCKPEDRISFVAHSGRYSCRIGEKCEYSAGFILRYSEISPILQKAKAEASVFVFPVTGFDRNPTDLVLSVQDKKGTYGYCSVTLDTLNLVPGQWNPVSLYATLPEIRSGNDVVKLYFWHRGKKAFFVDDMSIRFLFRN